MVEIQYRVEGRNRVSVFLEGIPCGTILRNSNSNKYSYKPKGSKSRGEMFDTLRECKDSLEEE